MASYEQAPDTQSYSFQPYNLPYNQIMQTVAAKTNYWLQGANQIKSAYQQAAGLNLSLDQNREALRSFTDQANQQITQAAKSDLSQADNVGAAMNIFKPLYDGSSDLSQQIMGDHAVTTQAQEIQSQYATAKTKNNGKEYSPVNEQYSLQAYQDFVKNGDPTKWKDAYQGLKQYTPYYDYHKEMMDNIRACHGSSTTTTGVNGMYITSATTSGVDSDKMAGCLGSNLSSQAEAQMAIEGNVKYGRNYRALADDYQPVALQNRNVILSQKAQAVAMLGNPNIPADQKATIQQHIKDLDSQVDNIDQGTAAIQKGDMSYIQNNYDQLSAAMYRGQKIKAMGDAFSYVDKSQELKADPVQMMYARFKEDNNLLTQRENFDKAQELNKERFELNKMSEEYKLKWELENGKLGTITPMIPTTDPDGAPKLTQATFEAQKATTAKAIQDNEANLYQHLSTSPVTKDLVVGNPTTNPTVYEASKQAILNTPTMLDQDPWLKAYKAKADQLQLDKNIQMSTDQAVQASAPVVAAKNAVSNVINSITQPEAIHLSTYDPRGFYVPHGAINLSPQDMKDLLQGKAVRGMTLGRQQQLLQGSSTGIGGGSSSVSTFNTLNFNGQQYNIGGSRLEEYIQKRDGSLNGYGSVVDDAYNRQMVSNPTWGNLSNYNGPEAKQVKNLLQSGLSGLVSIPEDKDVKLLSTSWDGKIRFTVPANNKGNFPSQSDLSAAAGRMGLADIKSVPGVAGMYEATGVSQFNRAGDVGFAQKLQTFAENLQQLASSGQKFPRTPMLQNYHGINITAVQDPNGQLIYELQDKNSPQRINYATSPTQLVSILQQLNP